MAGKSLIGRVIIVTGAAGGIGAATAHLLGAAGAKVVLTDIVPETEDVVEAIRQAGGEACFIEADMAEERQIAALVDKTIDRYGRLDGAFNNAGVEQAALPLAEISTAQWDRVLRIDLTAVFHCLKYEILAMQKSGGGAIVNTASSLGQIAIPAAGEYIAAKHGVIGLTRAAAVDYAAQGIRVNAVLPGMVNTPIVRRISQNPDFQPILARLRDRHPMGRFGEPEEIGEMAMWLLSDAASFVTGATFGVDGGYLAS